MIHFLGIKKTETYINAKSIFKERLQQLEQVERLKQLETTNFDYKAFSDIKNSILYLDQPYEGTSGYEVGGKARSVLPDVYNKMRQNLLKMPAGSVIVENEIEYKFGTHPQNRRIMYVKDLRIQTNSFDSQSFYDWAYEMSKKNIVLISSYEISDERFECAYEFKKARSTFRGGISNKNNKIEKLFMIKKEKNNGISNF